MTSTDKTYILIIFGLVLVILGLVYLYSKKKQPEPLGKLAADGSVGITDITSKQKSKPTIPRLSVENKTI
jgi:LPXTG-motif cell wall-anchored protein